MVELTIGEREGERERETPRKCTEGVRTPSHQRIVYTEGSLQEATAEATMAKHEGSSVSMSVPLQQTPQ